MKRVAVVLFGIAVSAALSGCCCSHGGCWPWWGGYGAACPGGACGVAPASPQIIGPQGAYQSYDSIQAGFPQVMPGPVAASPGMPPVGPPLMAYPPMESLPTY